MPWLDQQVALVHPDLKIGYVGAGSYLPAKVLTNDDLAEIVDTDNEWIVRRTGIRERRILAEDESILDMAVGAALAALEDANVDPSEITDIRVGVNTWARFPSLATQLQARIGAEHASAADVSAGCAGFVYAVEEAYNKLYVERVRDERRGTALVVGVDGLSHITNWRDRSTCVLLGDGAGAVVMREVDSGGIMSISTCADGQHGDLLYSDSVLEAQWDPGGPAPFSHVTEGVRPYLHMDGRRVYGVAVKTMVEEARKVIEMFNRENPTPIGVDDVAFVYPHQANLRIIEKVASKLDIPLDRVYTTGIERFGNTSTASIPIGYVDPEARAEPSRPGDYEIDVAFGSGFAAGAILRQVGEPS
ncbi:MAG: beta-ketoacyl-ACP synthase 3 [Acidobacteria bacterium]|nr:beta-ketoacyl-ACP synthase 3 [Acidobacteriota bacterium]